MKTLCDIFVAVVCFGIIFFYVFVAFFGLKFAFWLVQKSGK